MYVDFNEAHLQDDDVVKCFYVSCTFISYLDSYNDVH